MPHVEVIHHGALILSFFPALWTEGEACLLLQSLWGMYALETRYFGGLEGHNCSEEVEVFGRPPNHVVGRAKFFPPHPLVMNRVVLSA